jgi:hypothetical protein
MLGRYAGGGSDEEIEMLSEVMLRVMLDERERATQEHLRVRHLLGGRRGTPRRVHVASRLRTRQAEADGAVR